MSEQVGRIPLLRTRRLRPRKPKPWEWVGLVTMVGFGVESCMCWDCVTSGRYLDAHRTRFGHDWPHSVAFDYTVVGFALIVSVACFVFGVVLAWDWLKNPWEEE